MLGMHKVWLSQSCFWNQGENVQQIHIKVVLISNLWHPAQEKNTLHAALFSYFNSSVPPASGKLFSRRGCHVECTNLYGILPRRYIWGMHSGWGGRRRRRLIGQELIRTNCPYYCPECVAKRNEYTLYSLSSMPCQQLEAAYQHHNLLLIVLNPCTHILQSSIPCHTNSAKKYITDMALNRGIF